MGETYRSPDGKLYSLTFGKLGILENECAQQDPTFHSPTYDELIDAMGSGKKDW